MERNVQTLIIAYCMHIACSFSIDIYQSPLLFHPSFRFIFSAFLAGIRIFITSRGRIRDEIYDVLLTNPSREVAWRRIVYLRMHTSSIGRQSENKTYFSKMRDEFRSPFILLYYIIRGYMRVRVFPYK